MTYKYEEINENRVNREGVIWDTIINIINVSGTNNHEYITFINCVYACQKDNIRLNVLELSSCSQKVFIFILLYYIILLLYYYIIIILLYYYIIILLYY